MNILRFIFAITTVAVFSITIVLESAAHASTNDCLGDHCHVHVSADAHDHVVNPLVDHHSHDQNSTEHECCDQLSCQTVDLTTQHLINSPASFDSMNWDKADQLTTLFHQSNLDRPPNP